MPFLICARHKPSVVSDTAMLRLENGSNPFVLFYVLIWIEGHILLNMQVPSYYNDAAASYFTKSSTPSLASYVAS